MQGVFFPGRCWPALETMGNICFCMNKKSYYEFSSLVGLQNMKHTLCQNREDVVVITLMRDTQLTTFANLHLWIKFQLKWIFSRQQWGSEDTAKVCSHKINQWSICAEQTRQQGEHISKWKKSEESWPCRALSSAASVCSWKDQSWQQDLLLDHLEGQQTLLSAWVSYENMHSFLITLPSQQSSAIPHCLSNHSAWRWAWRRGWEPSWHLNVLENIGRFFFFISSSLFF